MSHFTRKSVVITGASRGIGEAAARHLAQQGAQIVLAARSTGDITRIAAEIVANGGSASAVQCDVSRYEDVKAAIDHAVGAYGKLDVLVNNAGLIDPVARLADSDPAAWGHVVDVNLKGVYYGLHAAIAPMLTNGGGTVINISSGAATAALEGWSHYCSTKAGVLSLTKCADTEYRDQGIRVLGLSPGTVATDMQVAIKASGINPVSQLAPSVHIPADWVAQAIAFLCKPEADSFLGTDFALRTDEARKLLGLPTA